MPKSRRTVSLSRTSPPTPGGNSARRKMVPRGGGGTPISLAARSAAAGLAGDSWVTQSSVEALPACRCFTFGAGASISTVERPSARWPVTIRRTTFATRLGFLGGASGGNGCAQAEEIAVHAEAADLALHHLGEHRVAAEFLARVDVRHVHFDHRHLEDGERVADAVAVVGPGARVDHHGIGAIGVRGMNALAHRALDVGLEAQHFDAK